MFCEVSQYRAMPGQTLVGVPKCIDLNSVFSYEKYGLKYIWTEITGTIRTVISTCRGWSASQVKKMMLLTVNQYFLMLWASLTEHYTKILPPKIHKKHTEYSCTKEKLLYFCKVNEKQKYRTIIFYKEYFQNFFDKQNKS